MLLVVLTVYCIFLGPSAGKVFNKELCYGDHFKMPDEYTPPVFNGSLYFTQNEGSRMLMMDGGKIKIPRLTLSSGSVYLKDVTNRDEGFFSISDGGIKPVKIITLKILDCADRIKKYYGTVYNILIPSEAEYLEFAAQVTPDRSTYLWMRSRPDVHGSDRVTVKDGAVEIHHLTQADNGHYNIRDYDYTILSRQHLTVRENTRRYVEQVEEKAFISYPSVDGTWTVTFIPAVGGRPQTVMKAGRLVLNNDWFLGRIQTLDSGIEIDHLEEDDSGIFEFRDQKGYLALKAELEAVDDYSPTLKYLVIISLVVLLIGVCCYKYVYRNKYSSQTSAESSKYIQDENQPHHSYTATTSDVTKDSKTSSTEQLVGPSEERGSPLTPFAGRDFLSLDAKGRLDLKGATFLSPLDSDPTPYAVYYSDKLNFLQKFN